MNQLIKEQIDKEQTDKEESLTRIQATGRISFHSGPLPPPDQLIEYNKAVPNAADRILKMTERQLEHRVRCEELLVRQLTRNATYGVFCALALGMTAIICGTFLLYYGRSLTGFGVYITAIATLVGVFIYEGKSEKKKEAENT